MASVRLSKIQRWILGCVYESGMINRKGLKRYFNKGLKDPLTNSEREILYRSVSNLLKKGLLEKAKYRNYLLTEKGVDALKTNVSLVVAKSISFKDYQEREEESRMEDERWLNSLKALITGFRRRRGSTHD